MPHLPKSLRQITLVLGFLAAGTLVCGCTDEAPLDIVQGTNNAKNNGKADNPAKVCTEFATPATTGTMKSDWAEDVSGIVASKRHPGVFWAVNDKGSDPLLMAFDRLGHDLGTFKLNGVENRDWEDLAIEPGDTADTLVISDTGDKGRTRESARIFRVPEPVISLRDRAPAQPDELEEFEELKLVYADGIPRDAEAILVDPVDLKTYVISRASNGERTEIFEAVRPTDPDEDGTLEPYLNDGGAPELGGEVVAADISPDGSVVSLVFRDEGVRVWPRETGSTLAQTLTRSSCAGPAGGDSVRSIALSADGQSWFSVLEDAPNEIRHIQRALTCPKFSDVAEVAAIGSDMARELSGLVASRDQPGVSWTHNDGDDNLLMAFGESGEQLGTWWLNDSPAKDWEDLAWGPTESGGEALYAADTGSNDFSRTSVEVFRFQEPTVELDAPATLQVPLEYETFELEYGDDNGHDAEAMFVDPGTGDVYVITKGDGNDPKTKMFRAKAPLNVGSPTRMDMVLSEANAPSLKGAVVAADIDRTGTWVAVAFREDEVRWFNRNSDELWHALQGQTCTSEIAPGQLESLAITPEGDAVLMVPEGTTPGVFRVDLN